MSQKTEIQILSRILNLLNRHHYYDEEGLAINLSRAFIQWQDQNNFLKNAGKIKTSFFRKNKVNKDQFLSEIHKEVAHLTINAAIPRFPKQIFWEDVDSFSRARKVKASKERYLNLLEIDVKKAFLSLIGEPNIHKDSSVEMSDIFTPRIKLNGENISTAIALNGRGKFKTKKKEGIFEIADSGKNGNQINRLFEEPAKLFILQCVGQFSNYVCDEMYAHAYKKSKGGKEEIYYCLIDGNDTDRIIRATSGDKK